MEERPKDSGGSAFDALASKLVKVPKAEIDQQKRKVNRARKKRKRK
jgi:hypothetical protein